ncbi:MAG: hypothetical protein HC895_06955 [Leptolyngbyaceae cyanobacterium SM1_3_5]|nr:hypothetical protein [Leptolyngbyaceae cyanobacterium SM1_3_5]
MQQSQQRPNFNSGQVRQQTQDLTSSDRPNCDRSACDTMDGLQPRSQR